MNFDSAVKNPRYAGLYGPAKPRRLPGEKQDTQPDRAFLDDWLARSTEIVDKYQPEVVWFDWWIEQPVFQWLAVNGEAIYGTRPWKVFGEGPTQVLGGGFTDRKQKSFTAQDIRFTRKGNTVYAIALDWPGKQAAIKSLGANAGLLHGKIVSVRLLGTTQKLKWKQDAEALAVELPEARPCDYAYAFRIDVHASITGPGGATESATWKGRTEWLTREHL